MQSRHTIFRAAATTFAAFIALVAAAVASAAVSADATPAQRIDWQAITDAANAQPYAFN